MGELLNEYFASVLTKKKDFVDDESGKGAQIVLVMLREKKTRRYWGS